MNAKTALPVFILSAASALLVSFFGFANDPPTVNKPQPIEVDGLHNVFRINDNLFSGNSPDGDASFESLKKLGVKTIISVDGATPDVERAKKFGMRYVHAPIGYNAVPDEKALVVIKALRELDGPFYLHCHHGKHRGPAVAAIAAMCMDDKCSTEQALEVMKTAGTDPKYKGLFKSVKEFKPPTDAQLAALPKDLPEVVKPADIVQAMVAIDFHFENLKKSRGAGWKTPADSPDVEPPHEALQLWEHYVELKRQPDTAKRPDDFRQWLDEAEAAAKDMEQLLRAGKTGNLDKDAVEKTFRRVSANCAHCHAKYRDE
jgi:protein tyrosine phosphatase (PTP) superfamily phosphohydrolase (DUF442 family)